MQKLHSWQKNGYYNHHHPTTNKNCFYLLILFAIIIDYQYITLIISERQRGSNPSLERKKKSPTINSLNSFSGERGIRTPGASQHGSFQDYQCSDVSKAGAKVGIFFETNKFLGNFFVFIWFFARIALPLHRDLSE